MRASFMQRFLAYLIDVIIVSIFVSIFATFMTSEKYQELSKQEETVIKSFTDGEITMEEYVEQTKNIEYRMDKENFNLTLLGLGINIGYFIAIQFINKGQTIGKRLMKIRIKKTQGKLEAKDIVIRALIVNSILSTLVSLIAITFANQESYILVKMLITSLESIIVLISAIMILYRKDKLGLHDMITKTEVVSERNWK